MIDPDEVSVAAANGKPQRLVEVVHNGQRHRTSMNTDSDISRTRFIRKLAKRYDFDELELGWLDDFLVTATDEADAQAAEDAEQQLSDEGGKESQATKLVKLTTDTEMFHDPEGTPFARIAIGIILKYGHSSRRDFAAGYGIVSSANRAARQTLMQFRTQLACWKEKHALNQKSAKHSSGWPSMKAESISICATISGRPSRSTRTDGALSMLHQ